MAEYAQYVGICYPRCHSFPSAQLVLGPTLFSPIYSTQRTQLFANDNILYKAITTDDARKFVCSTRLIAKVVNKIEYTCVSRHTRSTIQNTLMSYLLSNVANIQA